MWDAKQKHPVSSPMEGCYRWMIFLVCLHRFDEALCCCLALRIKIKIGNLRGQG
jgi:hypothetical protein